MGAESLEISDKSKKLKSEAIVALLPLSISLIDALLPLSNCLRVRATNKSTSMVSELLQFCRQHRIDRVGIGFDAK